MRTTQPVRAPDDGGLSRRWIFAACDASLKRLATDWIDIYYLHKDDPHTPIAETIAALGAPVEALVFGPGDFAASMGIPVLTIGFGSFEYALARIAVAARANGLQPVDGPYADLGDLDGLRRSSAAALAHGYDGKWVVHPDQIEPVNAAFTPAVAEVERARRILAAEEGASLVDGEMVDVATKRMAASVLARAGERVSREG